MKGTYESSAASNCTAVELTGFVDTGFVDNLHTTLFRFIVRADRLVINGNEVLHPRERATLRADAIPTIFPNLPGYLTRQLPKERKRKATACLQGPPPNKVCLVSEEVEELPAVQVEDPPADEHAPPPVFTANLCCPSDFWSRQLFPDKPCLISYQKARFLPEKKPPLMLEKVVLFETDEVKGTKCTIHLSGILHQEKTVTSVSDAEGVLNCVGKLTLCAGVGEICEFSVDLHGTSKHLFGTRLFSDRCTGVVNGKNFFTDPPRICSLLSMVLTYPPLFF